ncbi:MAG: hypothetical protein ACRD4F_03655, partial [Candidatus Angelobacter sp.]
MKKNLIALAIICSLFATGYGRAQTFEIGGQPSPQKQKQQSKKGKKKGASQAAGHRGGAQASSSGTCAARESAGWGGSIESGRYARAAQTALKKGNYGGAMGYSQHLIDVAPNDACN